MNEKALKLSTYIICDSLDIGGNWGFVMEDNPEYEEILKILLTEKSIKVIELANGVLVFGNKNYALQISEKVVDKGVNAIKFWNTQDEIRLNENTREFQKYLTKIYQNNIKPTYKGNGYREYTFALFSCNKSGRLRIDCVDYPAFSLKLNEAIQSLVLIGKKCKLYLYSSDGFKLIQNFSDMVSIYKGLEISKSLNGVLMTMRLED